MINQRIWLAGFLLCLALVEGGCVYALHEAARSGNTQEVIRLLDQNTINADPNKVFNGFTALCLAAREGHEETVVALLERGALVNAKSLAFDRSKFGIFSEIENASALACAAEEQGHPSTVRLLLDKGARVNESALQIAKGSGNELVLSLLEEAFREQSQGGGKSLKPGKVPRDAHTQLSQDLSAIRTASRRGDDRAALTLLRRAFRRGAKNAELYKLAIEILRDTCDYEGAVKIAKEARQVLPNDEELQRVHELVSDQAQASSSSGSASCRAQTLNRDGVSLAKEQKLQDALMKFEEAARIAPGTVPKAHYNAALVLELLGRPQEALRQYVAAQQSFLLPEDEREGFYPDITDG